jgi:hypothetical protein
MKSTMNVITGITGTDDGTIRLGDKIVNSMPDYGVLRPELSGRDTEFGKRLPTRGMESDRGRDSRVLP